MFFDPPEGAELLCTMAPLPCIDPLMPYADPSAMECWLPGTEGWNALANPKWGTKTTASSLNIFDFATPQRARRAKKLPKRPPGVHLPAPPGQFYAAPVEPKDLEQYLPGQLFVHTASMALPQPPQPQRVDASIAAPPGLQEASASRSSGESATGAEDEDGPSEERVVDSDSASETAPGLQSAPGLEAAPGLEPADPSEVPSEGSRKHFLGDCKPCAFVNADGCKSGANCRFCHLCEPGEKKMRKKRWKEQKRNGLLPVYCGSRA